MRSGKVVDVFRASNADGAAVVQWPDNGKPNQQWAFQSTGDGYHTVTCVGSGKVLDVEGSSTADGAAVVQATADGRTSQQWQLRPQTGDEFILVNRNSGKVLDVKAGSTAEGAALIQYRDVGNSNHGGRRRTGIPWEYLPHDFPPFKTVYDYYAKSEADGTTQQVHDLLRDKTRRAQGRSAEPTAAVIDAQSVKTSANVAES
ncbi:RICIN domain-containing protein, partial [Streptomyces sp. AC550_RSS872]|uniref:RICIN domain-containing protein n=1 Tax=Streptomyces sp. AC550_RSS872 TaxID=2823689 RepID=UPI0027E463A7